MRKFLVWFLIFVSLYHIVVTYVSFWLWRLPPYSILLLRDVSWIVAILLFVLWNLSYLRKHISQWGNFWLLFLILLISSVGTSIVLWVDAKQMIVWIKYSLYYILPLLSWLYVWWVRAQSLSEQVIKKWIHIVWKVIVGVLIVWWVWQILKNLAPWFMTSFWYGALGDYVYWQNPPLYYLTWPKWFQRWSWIFSWPNNYWYLLVAFFWLYWYGVKAYVANMWWKIALRSLFIVTLLATLSRCAILWVLVQIILISYIVYSSKRKMILLAIIAWVGAVIWLSVLKRESTIAHVKAKFDSLQYVQQSPLWYWLWSSWPSIHSQWWYLPENFFIQLMMDLWMHGFIIWAIFWIMFFLVIRRLYQQKPSSRNLLFFVSIWFVWLMVEWLFLHALEDSMVNYMYFIVWWIIVWYVANEHRLFRSHI